MKEVYRVGEFDTLESIARKYELSEKEILIYNNLKAENIKQGLYLVINKLEGKRYVVKPFDTLQKIADKFGISIEKIREHNKINEVFLGQIIYIPNIE